jgi:hypothetical protein
MRSKTMTGQTGNLPYFLYALKDRGANESVEVINGEIQMVNESGRHYMVKEQDGKRIPPMWVNKETNKYTRMWKAV